MIAIPLHQSRVAPVLDWCSTIVLIAENACKPWHEGERLSVKGNVFDLLRLLHHMNVSPVICGALSPNALHYGRHLGLEFICGISGAIDEVVAAYRVGELDHPRFRLPGCRCTGFPRSLAGLSPSHSLSEQAGIRLSGDRGKGGVMSPQGRQGRGRRCAGRQAEGIMGTAVCVCPQCGREFPHRRGTPCAQSVCVTCGIPLVRKSPSPMPSS